MPKYFRVSSGGKAGSGSQGQLTMRIRGAGLGVTDHLEHVYTKMEKKSEDIGQSVTT